MLKNFLKNINCQGMTLLEILVALSVFSIVITGAINLFSSLIKYQKNLLDRAYVLSSVSYSTEYMSKAIRMAQNDATGKCITAGNNFALTAGPNLEFLNSNNDCQEFFLENGAIKVRKLSIAQNLTPSNIIIEGLNFFVSGDGQSNTLQPKVTFSVKAKAKNSATPSLVIQTTISQRMLDSAY
ncbi:MAG: prepilin-type N-terminal cleavage/methylation domain-containing protein [Candidatus Pacebacteria bacterium]|nr:prepilin-type N-terminal cleavage/methylation domain-containing protein [Candidatus Paceibacterota bacterium]